MSMALNLKSGNFLVGKHKSSDNSILHSSKTIKRKLQTSANASEFHLNEVAGTSNVSLLSNKSCNDSNVHTSGTCRSITNVNNNVTLSGNIIVHRCQFCKNMFDTEILLQSHFCTALLSIENTSIVNSSLIPAYNLPLPSETQTKSADYITKVLQKKYKKILLKASIYELNIDIENIMQVKVSSKERALSKRIASVFQCPVCSQYFEEEGTLNVHVAKDHSQYYDNLIHNKYKLPCNAVEREIYFCTTCQKIFSSQNVSHTHYTLVSDNGLQCILCDNKFDSKAAKLSHEHIKHGRNNKYLFLEDLQLLQSSTHTPHTEMSITKVVTQVYACSSCTQIFHTKQGILKHLSCEHSDLQHPVYHYIEHFICNLCPENTSEGVFKKASDYLIHCQATHVSSIQNTSGCVHNSVTSANSVKPVNDFDTTAVRKEANLLTKTQETCNLVESNLPQPIKEEIIDPDYIQINKDNYNEEEPRNLNSSNSNLPMSCEDLNIPEMKIEIEENKLQEYYEESISKSASEIEDNQRSTIDNAKNVTETHTEVPHSINLESVTTSRHPAPSNKNIQAPVFTLQSESYCEIIETKHNQVCLVVGKKVTKRVYMCLRCSAHFFDVSHLQLHTKVVHPDMFIEGGSIHAVTELMERWLCDLCRPSFKLFTIKVLYHNHLKSEHRITGQVDYRKTTNYEILIDKKTQSLINATFKFVASSNPTQSPFMQPLPGGNTSTQLIPPNNSVLNQNSGRINTVINPSLFNNTPQAASPNNLVVPQNVIGTNNVLNQNQLVMTVRGLLLVPNNQVQEHLNLMSNPLTALPQFTTQQMNFSLNPMLTQGNSIPTQPSIILPPVQRQPFPNSQIIVPQSQCTSSNLNSLPQTTHYNPTYLNHGSGNKNSRLGEDMLRNKSSTQVTYRKSQNNSVAVLTKHGLQRVGVNIDYITGKNVRDVNSAVIVNNVPKLVDSGLYTKVGNSLKQGAIKRNRASAVAVPSGAVVDITSDDDETSDTLITKKNKSLLSIGTESTNVDKSSVATSTNTNILTSKADEHSKANTDINGPNFAELAIKQNMTFECCYCKKILFSEKQYIIHKNQCHDNISKVEQYKVQVNRYVCPNCLVHFHNQDNMESHFKLKHRDCKPTDKQTIKQVEMYRCPNCLKCCISPLKLIYHIDTCKYSLNLKSVINCIKNKHFSCYICNACWFDTPEKLDAHIKTLHLHVKDSITVEANGTHLWCCSICPRKSQQCFVNIDLCYKHLVDSHEIFLTTEEVTFIKELKLKDMFSTYPLEEETLETRLKYLKSSRKLGDDMDLKCPKLSQVPVVVLERLSELQKY